MTSRTPFDDLIYFNGINGTTKDYAFPPATVEELVQVVLKQPLAEGDTSAAGFYQHFLENGSYALADDRDPKSIQEAGWGVIFADDEDPAVIEALAPLLELRRDQARGFYYEYKGNSGIRRGHVKGEDKVQFLQRRGAEPFGPADPNFAPYYFLIVGDPDRIPFQFQYELDVQYAVGRIHFRSPAEYEQYARNVSMAERSKLNLPRKAVFFGTEHDNPTQKSANYLVNPLKDQMLACQLGWDIKSILAAQATRANLEAVVNGKQAPAFLFTASHGMYFMADDERQRDRQGALLCQDFAEIEPGDNLDDCYFWAGDVATDANMLGSVVFNFACFSAGTPQVNSFLMSKDRRLPTELAKQSFVSRLPQQLLLRGALAVVGHVERAYVVSISYSPVGTATDTKHLATYRSVLRRLFDGYPVGAAMEWFNEKYGEYATAVTRAVEAKELALPTAPDDYQLIGLWLANNDCRNYTVIGDPAVRMSVAAKGEPATAKRPTLPEI